MARIPVASLPSFRKGQVVTTRCAAEGVRPMTREESRAWYEFAYTNWGPHDSAGESWVHSGTKHLDLPADTRLEVVRARVTATVGWGDRPGYAEVVNLATGEHFKVHRSVLRAA